LSVGSTEFNFIPNLIKLITKVGQSPIGNGPTTFGNYSFGRLLLVANRTPIGYRGYRQILVPRPNWATRPSPTSSSPEDWDYAEECLEISGHSGFISFVAGSSASAA